MSITAFNIRLTSLSSKKWQVVNWTFFTTCAIYTLVAFFLNVFQCNPAGGSFDLFILARSGSPPTCVGVAHMNTILRAINITLDYCLLAVPVIVLWKAQMSWKMKGRLFVMFSVGGLACVGSVMTLVSKFRLKSDALCKFAPRTMSTLSDPIRELYWHIRLVTCRAVSRYCSSITADTRLPTTQVSEVDRPAISVCRGQGVILG